MRLLLDTHVLLGWLTKDERLHPSVLKVIAGGEVYVSAATVWEMAIKSSLGKLRIPTDLESQMSAADFRELPVTIAHAAIAAQLPLHHKDPFDRMLVAQAFQESLTLLTNDAMLAHYNARVMFVSG